MRHVIIILMTLAVGCSPRVVSTTEIIRDTTTVTHVKHIRDTIVTVEADSSIIRMLLECDSLNQVRIKSILDSKGGRSIRLPDISLDNNVITAKAVVPATDHVLRVTDTRHDIRSHLATQQKLVVEINKLRLYQKILMSLGVVFILIIIIKIKKYI